jgi:hypothetical protein
MKALDNFSIVPLTEEDIDSTIAFYNKLSSRPRARQVFEWEFGDNGTRQAIYLIVKGPSRKNEVFGVSKGLAFYRFYECKQPNLKKCKTYLDSIGAPY